MVIEDNHELQSHCRNIAEYASGSLLSVSVQCQQRNCEEIQQESFWVGAVQFRGEKQGAKK